MRVLADANGKFNTTLHGIRPLTRTIRLAWRSKRRVALAVPGSGWLRHSTRQVIQEGKNE